MKKVCCWGTFDIIHEGHREFLRDIKKRGNKLFVFVVSDKAVKENKNRKPIHTQKTRAEKLRKIKEVDKIFTPSEFEDSFKEIIKINPNIFAFGYDQNKEFQKKVRKFCRDNKLMAGFYISKKFAGGIHTSDLIKNVTPA